MSLRRGLPGLAALLVLVACSGPGAVTVGPPAHPVPDPASPAGAPWPAAPVAWAACPASDAHDVSGWECGTVRVPVDYQDPAGATIDLAITRRPASEATARIGSLVVNPGGPGASGVEAVHHLVEDLPQDLLERFDLVGFDPRGVGTSSPVDCLTDEGKDAEADLDWLPATAAAADDLLDVLARGAARCAREQGDLLPYLGTMNGARDLDVLRAAVGDERLTYLGFSYGTSLGATYADLYPTHVRALVLDGPIDPTAGTGILLGGGEQEATGSGDGYSAQDFDAAFDHFGRACAAAATCALEGEASAAFDELRGRVVDEPVAAEAVEAEDGRRLTVGLLESAVASALYDPSAWPFLAVGLQDGLDGDGSVLIRMADEMNGRAADGTWDSSADAFRAVTCADFPSRPSGEEARDALLGRGDAAIDCVGWPRTAEPLRSVSDADTPTILVIGTKGDPATPYENAAAMADALGQAVVLTWEGEGHTAFAGQSSCIDDAVTAYLVDERPPADGASCPIGGAGASAGDGSGADGGAPSYELDRDGMGAALAEGIEAGGWSAEVASCVADKATADMTDAELVRFWYTTDTFEEEDAVFRACGSSYDGP